MRLTDLSQIADEDLKHKAWLGMLELSLKHIDARDLLPFIRDVVTLLQKIERAGGTDYIKTIFHYLFSSGEVSSAEALVETLHDHLSPTLENTVMTIAQQFEKKGEARGIEKGRQEGHQEGRQEGRQEAMREFAAQLLKAKVLPDEKIAALTGLSLETIQALQCRKTAY